MDWINLQSEQQLEALKSEDAYAIIFKHSTRCSISLMAKRSFEQDAASIAGVPAYYLDLLNFRSISAQIAQDFEVTHQSPQVLLLKNGECIYHASHEAIDALDLAAVIERSEN